jgi:hypothetical protein
MADPLVKFRSGNAAGDQNPDYIPPRKCKATRKAREPLDDLGKMRKVQRGAMMNEGGRPVEGLIFLGVIAVWLILQLWVLPKAGVGS